MAFLVGAGEEDPGFTDEGERAGSRGGGTGSRPLFWSQHAPLIGAKIDLR